MTDAIAELFAKVFSDEGVVFMLSILPISEIRGGMLYAGLTDMNMVVAFAISFIGNMLPIPVILLFIRRILAWMRTKKGLGKVVDWVMCKADKGSKKLGKYTYWGLYLFVAIPLPGTGAWTGALVANFLDLPIKKSLPAITAGVLTAGVIITTLAYTAPDLFKLIVG